MTMPIIAILALTAALAAPPTFLHEGPAAIDEQTTIVAEPPRVFRIAILPDRTTGRDWGLPYLKAAVNDLNRIAPDAVFTIGDMVQGYTRDPAEWQRQADQWKAITEGLHAQLFPVAGNHDVISGSRVPGDRAFGDRYLRTFGPLRYMAELHGATVIAMFSDEGFGDGGVQLSDGQVGWLKNCLTRAKERALPIVVLMHRPLWRTESVKWFERVHPALADAGVDAVIAGHFHSMQDDGVRDGVHYDIVGTCGGSIDQHPLAGQMQHLTFVQARPDGSLDIFHQPVGATLPVDFVVREDQDRVFALRERPGSAKLEGVLPDPMDATAPLGASITLAVTNPLDRPIEVEVRPWISPEAWPVEGEVFTSRTSIDAFNPFTVDAKTAYRLAPVTPFTVPPGGTVRVPLAWSWPRASAPVAPPTFVVQERFVDSKGRSVPVFLWQRPAVERHVCADGSMWPIHAWAPSPYDTLEADPRVAFTTLPDGGWKVRVEAPDSVAAKAPADARSPEKRMRDPGGDAFRVDWNDASGEHWLLVEPFTPATLSSVAGLKCTVRSGALAAGGWWAEAELPPGPGLPRSVNVGVADNDETYHTQWRWLAPAESPAKFAAPPKP